MQLRRRLRSGLAASVDYTWAKAIDDDAQVGAQGHVVSGGDDEFQFSERRLTRHKRDKLSAGPSIAQNWLDLRAERDSSTFSTSGTLLKAQIQYTTGMGMGGGHAAERMERDGC